MTDWVIVGHGLTPEGKGWGEYIDLCETVVRMWNWHWQNLSDYGRRYDYGFYEIHPTEMKRFHRHNTFTPKEGWVATKLRKPYTAQLPEPTEIVDDEPWNELGEELGGLGLKGRLLLTRGVRAAAWAITKKMERGQTLVLVGFDNVYTGRTLSSKKGFPQVFIDCPAGYPMHRYDSAIQTKTKLGNHDFAIEGPLLEKLAERCGINLVHAQDIWS